MKLQFRFLILYTFLFAAIAGGIFMERSFDLNHSQLLLQSDLSQRHSFFDKIVDLDGSSLTSLSTAYSTSDDMVSFVKSPDPSFAANTIDPSLKQYDADFAFVYNTNNSVVYHTASQKAASITDLKLPAVYFTHLYQDRLEHYFIVLDSGQLVEIRAATIHPSDDISRQTNPAGYFLVGRLWDDSYIKSLSNLTQANLSFYKSSDALSNSGSVDKDSLFFDTTLNSWQGTSLGVLRATIVVQSAKDVQELYNKQLMLLLVFTIASVVVLVLSIWLLVIRPMSRISRSIKRQRPKDLDRMVLELDNEFGDLAQTVQQFFAQKVQIEESTIRQQELEKLNKSKDDFLAVAAHELNAPVSNVKIFSEYLAKLLREGTTSGPEVDKQITRITHQAARIGVLIKDLRLASKGKQNLEFKYQDFDFDEFVKEEVEEAQFTTTQKLKFEGSTGKRIVSDYERLGQVVSNLIRNAAKYSSETDEIIIRIHGEGDNTVVAEVQDFGIGIEKSEQGKVFGRFFRSKNVAESYPGLGLGLSVCKEIIEKLGGRIWLESELGEGSHFFFSLPLKPPTEPSMLPTNPTPPTAESRPSPSVGETIKPSDDAKPVDLT